MNALHDMATGISICEKCLELTDEEINIRLETDENAVWISSGLREAMPDVFFYGEYCDKCGECILPSLEGIE